MCSLAVCDACDGMGIMCEIMIELQYCKYEVRKEKKKRKEKEKEKRKTEKKKRRLTFGAGDKYG